MPEISVIIPNYNHARYLDERIRSVLGQTRQDFEVILLDDCSPDDSRSVIERYRGDPRIRIEYNERNSGSTFRQWNKGLGLARGRYVWIAESDDAAEPELLETLAGGLDADEGAGLAYCWSNGIDEIGRSVDLGAWYQPHRARWAGDYRSRGRDEIGRWLVRRNFIVNASAVVFRREIAERVGGADPTYRLTGDWDFWVRLLGESDVRYSARALNRYRCHPASVRSRTDRRMLAVTESYRVVRTILGLAKADSAALKDSRGRLAMKWAEALIETGQWRPRGSLRDLGTAMRVDPWFLARVCKARRWLRLRGGEPASGGPSTTGVD